jgi:hypothetical protein
MAGNSGDEYPHGVGAPISSVYQPLKMRKTFSKLQARHVKSRASFEAGELQILQRVLLVCAGQMIF